MAFSGLHVTCCKIAAPPENRRHLPVLGKPQWSEAPADGSVSSNAAPTLTDASAVFEIYSAVDAYISIGGNPDAGASPRLFVPALTVVDVLVEPGDKFEWTAA
jgi:hypothetical protein